MRSLSIVCAVLCVLLVSSSAMAVNATWVNWSGDQDWSNGGNWNQAGVAPSAGDEAHFNVPGLAGAIVSDSASIARVVLDSGSTVSVAAGGNLNVLGQIVSGNTAASLGNGIIVDGGQLSVATEFGIGMNGTASMTVNSGTANANGGWLIAGYGAGSTGDIVVNDGALNVAGAFYLGLNGNGNLTVNGGAVNVNGNLLFGNAAAASNGVAILNGGVTTAAGVNMGGAGSANLTIEDGAKLVNTGGFVIGATNSITINGTGAMVFMVSSLEDVEWAVANLGIWNFSDGVSIVDNGVNGVSVSNVPEPATLSLLVLGAGALLRRRKK